jgi:hypothetical protein
VLSKKKIKEIEEKIALCKEYTQRWALFFNFFGDGFEGRKITAENEGKFFQCTTDLARREFRLSYFMAEDFTRGSEILDILSKAVSLNHIHEMSEAQFSKFQLAWHQVFIALNKCLGRLMQQLPEVEEKKEGA